MYTPGGEFSGSTVPPGPTHTIRQSVPCDAERT